MVGIRVFSNAILSIPTSIYNSKTTPTNGMTTPTITDMIITFNQLATTPTNNHTHYLLVNTALLDRPKEKTLAPTTPTNNHTHYLLVNTALLDRPKEKTLAPTTPTNNHTHYLLVNTDRPKEKTLAPTTPTNNHTHYLLVNTALLDSPKEGTLAPKGSLPCAYNNYIRPIAILCVDTHTCSIYLNGVSTDAGQTLEEVTRSLKHSQHLSEIN